MQLFTPIKIGKVELKNRVVLPSLTNSYAKDGFVMENAIAYYAARARGGAAMICVEDGIVEFPRGNNAIEPVSVDDDKYIPMLAKLAAAIKKNGSVPAIQLSHAGRRAGQPPNAQGKSSSRGLMPVAPSMIGHPVPGYIVPRELEIDEIGEIIEKFGQGARRCAEAGFEVIGLHCAHVYLCGEFLSPWANTRTDRYGGSLDNRLRFILDVLARMRKETGDIPFTLRMNGEEPAGGNTPEEIREIAGRLEEAGVDAISVSSGFGPVLKMRHILPTQIPTGMPEGLLVPLAENIKAGVSIPVMVGNHIREPVLMEMIIRSGKSDLITLGRPLVADPEWVNKVQSGRYADVRPCVSCCIGCHSNVLKGKPMSCILNPLVGQEDDTGLRLVKTEKPGRILVVGAGPAGMEAALTASARGHDVTVWEKSGKIGGSLNLAEIPPRKDSLRKIIAYFENRLAKSNVTLELGREADVESICGFRPDAVIVAAGGESHVPPIKGVDGDNVFLARDVLDNRGIDAGRVVVIGGGQVGIELAEYLAEKGAQVTIAEALDAAGGDMYMASKQLVMYGLEDRHVRIVTGAGVKEITSEGVWIEKGGATEFLPAEAVVVAAGQRPRHEPADALRGRGLKVYQVGDNAAPGDIMSAVHAAYRLALSL
ncbi:MAG: NAD(P)/FAD-dependent oxidoreductase [Clostridiales bacterium]|nr:NAD(P)/FAD-dependent oxidoreductase [Clostridiales bacterium]